MRKTWLATVKLSPRAPACARNEPVNSRSACSREREGAHLEREEHHHRVLVVVAAAGRRRLVRRRERADDVGALVLSHRAVEAARRREYIRDGAREGEREEEGRGTDRQVEMPSACRTASMRSRCEVHCERRHGVSDCAPLRGRARGKESRAHLREDQALDPRRRALEERDERRRLGRPLHGRRAAVTARARPADAARARPAEGRHAALGRRRDDVLAREDVVARRARAASVDGDLDTAGAQASQLRRRRREKERGARRGRERGTHQFWQKKCWQIVMRPSMGQPPHARHSAPASMASLRSSRRYESCSADTGPEPDGMPVAFSWSCWIRAASLRSRMLQRVARHQLQVSQGSGRRTKGRTPR